MTKHRWWVGIAVVAAFGAFAMVPQQDDTDRRGRLDPSPETCANLQGLIDDGWTKRAAIDFAVLQVDEPDLDGILRTMLNRCDISR
jgi:hypothetical protein